MEFRNIQKGNVIDYLNILEIECGKIIAVIGKNGKGKTTLLRILSGNVLPDSGEIVIDEKVDYSFPIKFLSVPKYQRHFRNNVLYIENQNVLYHNLTCLQNINYFMSLGCFDKNTFWNILEKLEFDIKYLDCIVKELSLGTKQKIILSFAISSQKPIIILDEPMIGLDIFSKNCVLNILFELKKSKAIILSTNDVSSIFK